MAKRKIIVAEFAVTAYSDGSIDWDRFDQFLWRALVRAGLVKGQYRVEKAKHRAPSMPGRLQEKRARFSYQGGPARRIRS